MATLEQEIQMKETLAKNLEALTSISIGSLIRREELGASLNFEEGKPYFERVLKLFSDIKNANFGLTFEEDGLRARAEIIRKSKIPVLQP